MNGLKFLGGLFLLPFTLFSQDNILGNKASMSHLNPYNYVEHKNFTKNAYGSKTYRIAITELNLDEFYLKPWEFNEFDTLIVQNYLALKTGTVDKTGLVFGAMLSGSNDETRSWGESGPNYQFIKVISKVIVLDSLRKVKFELDYIGFNFSQIAFTQNGNYMALTYKDGLIPNDSFSYGLKILDVNDLDKVIKIEGQWSIKDTTDSLFVATKRNKNRKLDLVYIDFNNKVKYSKTYDDIDKKILNIQSEGVRVKSIPGKKETFDSLQVFKIEKLGTSKNKIYNSMSY